ncbi:sulfatase-like hydrolase/transferase [Sulfurovum sp. CS9]|uniref:sulfatase-like hydrolase/transferase n=1 Tax=Sulfurovum sp. CS9 TaxID=3391146 RepID=UPI0039EB0E76
MKNATIKLTVITLAIIVFSTTAYTKQPNVLLVVADDMGYSDIGSFGGEIKTPTLDQLAKEGIQMTGYHVLPTCSPTRSVLLSGTDNHRAGMGTMEEIRTAEMHGHPGYLGYLNFEVAALPEVLKSGGYRTYMAGKWHLGNAVETSPHARGFDETFALIPGGGSHWSDRKPLSPPQTMVYRRNGKVVNSLPADFYSTQYYTDRILEWLKRDRKENKPFFVYLSFTAPHDPLHAPKEYIARYKGVYNKGWDVLRQQRLQAMKDLGIVHKDTQTFPRLPSVKAWKDMSKEERALAARNMEVYAAMVDYMDEQIKRVLDYLKEIDEYDNTMILFFSDNGANGAAPTAYPGQTDKFLNSFDNSLENRGMPNSFIDMGPGWAQASMTPSRLYKGFPSEGGIRSPLLVKLPGKMDNAGNMNHSFMHVRDIMPTILDIANVTPPQKFNGHQVYPIQGSSMLALFEGKVSTPDPKTSQVGYELFGLKAFFDGPWKILRMPKPAGTGEWELFNLTQDPAEMKNLDKQYPDKLKKMVAQWEQYQKDNGVLDISYDLSEMVKKPH